MAKHGIKIISETRGAGAIITKGDRVRILFDVQLNRGDFVAQDQWVTTIVGDREQIAGFRYGIEGMRIGGTRVFSASPHLCYRDKEVERIPKNAMLIINIKSLEFSA